MRRGLSYWYAKIVSRGILAWYADCLSEDIWRVVRQLESEDKMVQSMFSVRDAKVRSHLFVTLHSTEGGAVRWFRDLMGEKPFNRHPEDYSLWWLGEFDSDTGAIVSRPPVEVGTSMPEVYNG